MAIRLDSDTVDPLEAEHLERDLRAEREMADEIARKHAEAVCCVGCGEPSTEMVKLDDGRICCGTCVCACAFCGAQVHTWVPVAGTPNVPPEAFIFGGEFASCEPCHATEIEGRVLPSSKHASVTAPEFPDSEIDF